MRRRFSGLRENEALSQLSYSLSLEMNELGQPPRSVGVNARNIAVAQSCA